MPTSAANADAAISLAPSRPAAALALDETSQAARTNRARKQIGMKGLAHPKILPRARHFQPSRPSEPRPVPGQDRRRSILSTPRIHRSRHLLRRRGNLTNAAKHSGASEAHVELSTTSASVVVEIRDNGRGGASLGNGSGIRGLADRSEALGGRFELQSPPRTGTSVRAELPCSKACAPEGARSGESSRLGTGFGDRFGDFRGGSRRLQGKVQRAKKPGASAGKAR